MTTLVISVLLGGWVLLFVLLAVVPLLPDVPAAVRIEDMAGTTARPVTSIAEHRAAA